NLKGPQGPQGPQGPEGPQGIPGDPGRIIFETFETIPPGMSSTVGVSIVDVPGTSVGKVMQVAGAFRWWYPGLSRAVPWDPNTLYRVEVRMRVVQDDSVQQQRFYAGIQTYDASGATVGNNTGNKYVAASAQTPVAADGWVTYVGWLRGEGAVNMNAWNPSTPSGIGADSAGQTA